MPTGDLGLLGIAGVRPRRPKGTNDSNQLEQCPCNQRENGGKTRVWLELKLRSGQSRQVEQGQGFKSVEVFSRP